MGSTGIPTNCFKGYSYTLFAQCWPVVREECVSLPSQQCRQVEDTECVTQCRDVYWCNVCSPLPRLPR